MPTILEETFAALAAQKRQGLAQEVDAAIRAVTTPAEHAAVAELVLAMAIARELARSVVEIAAKSGKPAGQVLVREGEAGLAPMRVFP